MVSARSVVTDRMIIQKVCFFISYSLAERVFYVWTQFSAYAPDSQACEGVRVKAGNVGVVVVSTP